MCCSLNVGWERIREREGGQGQLKVLSLSHRQDGVPTDEMEMEMEMVTSGADFWGDVGPVLGCESPFATGTTAPNMHY